jgi:membrane protein required for beta-lactamase induction
MKNDNRRTENKKRLERMPFGTFLYLMINIPHLFLLQRILKCVVQYLMTAYPALLVVQTLLQINQPVKE